LCGVREGEIETETWKEERKAGDRGTKSEKTLIISPSGIFYILSSLDNTN